MQQGSKPQTDIPPSENNESPATVEGLRGYVLQGVALVGIVVVAVIVTLWVSRDSDQVGVEVFIPPPAAVTFQISGEVVRPGVYSLEGDPRIDDAINIAGGLTPDAAADRINLALHVRDGAKVVVPSLVGDTVGETAAGSIGDDVSTPDLLETNPDSGTQVTASAAGLIDLNSATKDQLIALPGVGEVRADSIIEWRTNNLINTTSDLLAISGIGPSTVDSIRDYVIQP